MWAARLLIFLLALVLPGLLLAPAWQFAGLGADEDDLHYYSARVFFHETIQAGQLPWLTPCTGLGRPFVADPHAAVFYPGTWLFAGLEPLQGYPLSLWLHYSLALWGMYRLLRASRLARRAALFGGIAFAFSGFLLAQRADFSMQHAVAWTPWVLWRVQRYARAGGARRLALAALTAALQCFAGHVQIAAISALGSLVYLLAESRLSPRVGLRWLLSWSYAAGLFAVQWLPTLAYLRTCAPGQHGYLDLAASSWNPISAVGWILPMFFGQHIPNFFGAAYWGPACQLEQFAYAGILPSLLAAIAVRAGWRAEAYTRGWLALLLFGLLLALGPYGPIYPVLHWIPGANLFAVPARALLLFNLAVAALAAGALHDLGGELSPQRARLRAAALTWTRNPLVKALGLVVVPLTPLALALPFLHLKVRQQALSALYPGNPAVWIPALTVLASVALLWLVARRWRQPRWLGLLIIATTVDLAVIGWTLDIPADQPPLSARLATLSREAWLAHAKPGAERVGSDDRGQAFFEDATQPGAVHYIEKTPHSFVTRIDTWPPVASHSAQSHRPKCVRVVVSRAALPGWKAHSEHGALEVGATEEGMLVASVPVGGPLEVEWSYAPPRLHAGAAITTVTAILLACGALLGRFNRRKPAFRGD